MTFHYNGGSRQGTTERVNYNHITKWEFYTDSEEMDKNWTHSKDIATSTQNIKILCERGKLAGADTPLEWQLELQSVIQPTYNRHR